MKIPETAAIQRVGLSAPRTMAETRVDEGAEGRVAAPVEAPSVAVEVAAPSRGLAGSLTTLQSGASVPAEPAGTQARARAVEAEFGQWASRSPVAEVRAAVLQRHHISEEALYSLPDQERQAIETEIKSAIQSKQEMSPQTGKAESAA